MHVQCLKNMIFLIAASVAGCGVEVGNPKRPKPTTTGTSTPQNIVSDDIGAASEIVAGTLDETISLVTESYSQNSSAAFKLLGEKQAESVCEASSDGKVTITKTLKTSIDRTGKRGRQSIVYSGDIDSRRKATWSVQGTALRCNPAKTSALVRWTQISRATLTTEFTRTRGNEIKNQTAGKVVRESKETASGSRTANFEKRSSGSELIFRQTVWGETTRTISLSTKKSGAITMKSTVTLKETEPLVIESVFNSGEGLARKSISSATVVSIQEDNSKVELVYDNLVFDPSGGCSPQSGTIGGRIFSVSTDEAPARSFTMDFSGEGGLIIINYSDGQSQEIETASC
ncbi:MAG: hypothetical protein HQK54_15660, partial [Oligoflexales bacterium]|nr:hypothetical protein [Oligoflexales bacterium]